MMVIKYITSGNLMVIKRCVNYLNKCTIIIKVSRKHKRNKLPLSQLLHLIKMFNEVTSSLPQQ